MAVGLLHTIHYLQLVPLDYFPFYCSTLYPGLYCNAIYPFICFTLFSSNRGFHYSRNNLENWLPMILQSLKLLSVHTAMLFILIARVYFTGICFLYFSLWPGHSFFFPYFFLPCLHNDFSGAIQFLTRCNLLARSSN